jgi:hypothetical protein
VPRLGFGFRNVGVDETVEAAKLLQDDGAHGCSP